MTSVLQPRLAVLAVLVGTFVAVVLFVPFVVVSYRRRGGAGVWWVLGWVLMAVYLAGLVAYTLLPLPSAGYRCRAVQLVPLDDLRRLLAAHPSPGALLRSMTVWQLALNLLLFAPLGALLRVRHRRGVLVAGGVGLAVSLLIELTQLTGVWGVYPCAYRVFDVDDLLANTAGAVLGSLLALPFARRGERADAGAPAPVTALRRAMAAISDGMLVLVLPELLRLSAAVVAAGLGLPGAADLPANPWLVAAVWGVPLAVQLVMVASGGRTFGEWAVLLVTRPADGRPAWLARALRFLLGSGGAGVVGMADMLLDVTGQASSGPFAVVRPLLQATAQVLILLAVVGVWWPRDHRGIPALVAGLRVVDQRDRPSGLVAGGAAPAGGPRSDCGSTSPRDGGHA